MKKFIVTCLGIFSLFTVSAQTITNKPITVTGWWTGTNIFPYANGTNFWIDFGITNNNPRGYFIYQSCSATGDVFFTGITNATQWHVVSINVLANGGTRRIGITTNLPHMNTNGLVTVGAFYTLYLTNGCELRMSCETNGATLSTIWSTFGQSGL